MSKKPSRELTTDPVINRILDLLKQQGKTEKELAENLGLANGIFTAWKYGERKTYLQHIGPIADFLNVSMNYLLYGVDEEINEGTMSVTEVELLRLFRKMKPEQRECVLKTSKCFVALDI